MPESSRSDVAGAVRLLGGWGIAAEAGFAAEFYHVAADAGFPTTPDPFDSDLAEFGPAGAAAVEIPRSRVKSSGSAEAVLAICIFVGSDAGAWAIGQVCGGVWDRLRPALARLLGSAKVAEAGTDGTRIIARTVYARDSVVAEVDISLNSNVSPDAVAHMIADLQRLAAEAATRDAIVRFRGDGETVDGPQIESLRSER